MNLLCHPGVYYFGTRDVLILGHKLVLLHFVGRRSKLRRLVVGGGTGKCHARARQFVRGWSAISPR